MQEWLTVLHDTALSGSAHVAPPTHLTRQLWIFWLARMSCRDCHSNSSFLIACNLRKAQRRVLIRQRPVGRSPIDVPVAQVTRSGRRHSLAPPDRTGHRRGSRQPLQRSFTGDAIHPRPRVMSILHTARIHLTGHTRPESLNSSPAVSSLRCTLALPWRTSLTALRVRHSQVSRAPSRPPYPARQLSSPYHASA